MYFDISGDSLVCGGTDGAVLVYDVKKQILSNHWLGMYDSIGATATNENCIVTGSGQRQFIDEPDSSEEEGPLPEKSPYPNGIRVWKN